MRTLLVATAIRLPGRHGGTTHVGELLSNLKRYGDVLMLGEKGSTELGVVGIGTSRRLPLFMRPWMSRLQLPRALDAVREFRPEVIYERGSSYGLGALLSERLGIPMICMVLDEHYSARSLARASKIIATTKDVVPRQVLHKWVKVSWGANADLFSPEREPIDDDALPTFEGHTVGYAGSMKSWHDLDLLVDVAHGLRERKLRFVLIGDGPERPALERRVQKEGLEDRFTFTGALPYEEVPRWLLRCDVCVAPFRPSVHPNSKKGFSLDPLKVFEYLALGKPTLSVDAANIRALLDHEADLLLLPEGDVAGWTAALVRCLDDEPFALAMAERGRQKVLARHTWAAHAAHLNELFEEIAKP